MNNRSFEAEILMTEYRRIQKEAEVITAIFGKFSQPNSDENYPTFVGEFKKYEGYFFIFHALINNYVDFFNFRECKPQISGFLNVINACGNYPKTERCYSNPRLLQASFNHTLIELSAFTMKKINAIEMQYAPTVEVEKKTALADFGILSKR